MRAVRIQITPEFMRQRFAFPFATEFVGASVVTNRGGEFGNIEFIVEHPDLPELPEGTEPPLVSPTFKSNPPVEFVGWGLKSS